MLMQRGPRRHAGTGAWRSGRTLQRAFAAAWRFVREVSGDAAYDTYACHAGDAAVSREAFWLDALRRRYDTVSRCC